MMAEFQSKWLKAPEDHSGAPQTTGSTVSETVKPFDEKTPVRDVRDPSFFEKTHQGRTDSAASAIQNSLEASTGSTVSDTSAPFEEKLEPETLTAWDLLRADFHNLLENGLDPEDTRGSITVVADGPTGMVIGCNLRDAKELASHCRMLKEKYPDPLEIRISAQHDQTMHLRSRHTLAMANARSGVGMPVKA
jgi:hypothetical protein